MAIQEINIKEWDVSLQKFNYDESDRVKNIKSLDSVFDSLTYFFNKWERFEFGFLDNVEKYQIKYFSDDFNEEIVSQLDKAIERIINENLNRIEILQIINPIADKIEKKIDLRIEEAMPKAKKIKMIFQKIFTKSKNGEK